MRYLSTILGLLAIPLTFSLAAPEEPDLTFYLPLDGSIEPIVAAEKSQVRMVKDKKLEFAEGILGKGLLTGGDESGIMVNTLGNLSTEQWTISMWMKGLPNANWNSGPYLETFWGLGGPNGGMMSFYHYKNATAPWLYSRRDKTESYAQLVLPTAPEQEWHHWVTTWSETGGAFSFLDGTFVGPSPAVSPPVVTNLQIGQGRNPLSPPEHNKIIDEFKIYDRALDAERIADQYWRLARRPMGSALTAVPTEKKIEVDGRWDDAEWAGSAGFTGLVDSESRQLSAQTTSGKVSYDSENLYFVFYSENPPEARQNPDATIQLGTVKRDAVKHDDEVQKDDHFAIRLQPGGEGTKPIYTVLVNGIDTANDARNGDVSWDSQVSTKSNAGVEGWTLEVTLPLKSLGVDKITPGTKWNFNLERTWRQLRQGTDVWEPNGWGSLEFGEAQSASADLQKFEIGRSGAINASIALHNPSAAARKISIVVDANGKVLHEEGVDLAPNESRTLALSEVSGGINGNLVTLVVKEGDTVLLRRAAPLVLDSIGHIQLWKYPSQHQVRIGWELFTDASPEALHFYAEFKNESGELVREIHKEKLESLSGSVMENVKDLPNGKYILEVKVGEGTKVLQEDSIPYEKKALPSWVGNQLGISDTPPVPWTDVVVDAKKDTVSVWGRDYEYGKNLLPTQIINQGKEMLAHPMRFAVKIAGKSHQSSAIPAKAAWTETTAVRADSTRSQRLEKLEISNASYIEYDGMVWNEFEIKPQGSVTVDELILEIPLKKEWTELIKPYNDYRLLETGKLPAEGWKGDASKMPWVGNGDGGFQVFQEATATWVGSRVTEVLPGEDGSILMRLHIIDETVKLNTPLKFALGWMASPVKPAPKGYRDMRFINQGQVPRNPKSSTAVSEYLEAAIEANPNIQPVLAWWQGWWKVPENFKGNVDYAGTTPEPKENLSEEAGILHYRNISFIQAAYSRLTGEVSTANEWFEQFGDEWAPNTAGLTLNKDSSFDSQKTIVSQTSTSLQDFFLWGLNDLMERSQTKALYFDVSRMIDDTNVYHGGGLLMPDGSIEPTHNILGMREAYKRIYTLLKQRHSDGLLFNHSSGDLMLPVFSFADVMVDGENYAGILDRKENRGYEKTLSVDQFRAEYSMQNNVGPATLLLPQFERAHSINRTEWNDKLYKHVDYIMGLTFLHDSNLWWSFLPLDHVTAVYQEIILTGLTKDWLFVPYWKQDSIALPEGTYASAYQSPDKAKTLIVVMNTSRAEQAIALPLSLGGEKYEKVSAVYPTAKVDTKDEKLSIRLSNNDFSMYLLEKK